MKKYINYIVLILCLCISFQSCDDVIEEDITNDTIIKFAPDNKKKIEGNAVQFRWSTIAGADHYRFQINEDVSQNIVLDSLVNSSTFNYAIKPGNYQWRVRGENFAYQTAFTFASDFSMISSVDLSDQTVLLDTPQNNVYLNELGVTFSWKGIDTATYYKFQIIKKDNSSQVIVFEKTDVVDTSVTITATDVTSGDGEYVWQVKAYNEKSNSDYFKRTLHLDTENPSIPSLVSPSENQEFTTNKEVTFSWNFNTDTGNIGSEINTTLQIASDKDFNDISITKNIVTTEYKHTFTSPGIYYWRVRGKDMAGNIGDFNTKGVFKIN